MKAVAVLLFFISMNVFGQSSDTLMIHFQTNSSQADAMVVNQIKTFVNARNANTRFKIAGHTDNVGDDAFNERLSYKRELEIFQILIKLGIDSSSIQHKHFGETKPIKPNDVDANKAANRRVEIIRYQSNTIADANKVPLIKEVQVEERVQKKLIQSNGIILEYMSGALPADMEESINNGANPFQLIENTEQMQKMNMLTTTVEGVELSSLVIFCPPLLNPCKLDTPIVVRVPINNPFNCPLEKIIFLNAQVEQGKKRWKEISENIYPEIIDGKQYIRVDLFNTCACINFDYKIEMPCFVTDTTFMKLPKSKSVSVEVIVEKFNSVYQPKRINKTTLSLIIPKDEPQGVFVDVVFKLKSKSYNLKHKALTDFTYSEKKKTYYISKSTIKTFPE
jgi:hypothetical protein